MVNECIKYGFPKSMCFLKTGSFRGAGAVINAN